MIENISERITDAYEKATPNMLDSIRQACETVEQEPAENIVMFGTPKKNVSSFSRIAAVAACFLVVFAVGVGLGKGSAPAAEATEESVTIVPAPVCAATVFIDVNPSLSMDVSDEMKVIDCVANNEDAKKIVDDLELEDVDINTALNAVIGSMYMNGYLQDETRTMLVSVDSKKDGMLEEITKDVNNVLEKNQVDCDLITMDVDAKKVIEEAKKNDISAGKMGLVDYIVDNSVDYAQDDVAALSKMTITTLGEIKKLVDGVTPSLTPYIEEGTNQVANEIAQETKTNVDSTVKEAVKESGKAADELIKKTANEAIDVGVEHAKKELAKEIGDSHGINFVNSAIDGLAEYLKR